MIFVASDGASHSLLDPLNLTVIDTAYIPLHQGTQSLVSAEGFRQPIDYDYAAGLVGEIDTVVLVRRHHQAQSRIRPHLSDDFLEVVLVSNRGIEGRPARNSGFARDNHQGVVLLGKLRHLISHVIAGN
ncbi:hypothetical protein ASE87_10000 [Frigoribacterium sp. Leaf44]|nr:hypothetical protein ASE87_10000 [Frigoribacterium sp. Leaf44]